MATPQFFTIEPDDLKRISEIAGKLEAAWCVGRYPTMQQLLVAAIGSGAMSHASGGIKLTAVEIDDNGVAHAPVYN